MYEQDPHLNVDQLTIDRTSQKTGNLASNLIRHISSGLSLFHSDHLPVSIILAVNEEMYHDSNRGDPSPLFLYKSYNNVI